MGNFLQFRHFDSVNFSWNEVTGAIGDSVTVLPIVVAVGVLTDLSLVLMLVWFGVFQVVWGLVYGVPISVEPMKALAALILAGSITTGELLIAGLLLAAILLGIGLTNSLQRFGQYIGDPVVRGIQFGVALVLLETGLGLGLGDPQMAAIAGGIVAVVVLIGYWNVSALIVLIAGGIVAAMQTGLPTPGAPTTAGMMLFSPADLTLPAFEATIAQLAMTVGNAALATSVLLYDYFDRDISADDLCTSMGAMNAVAIPFGALPMCHGSGGVAGKYAFGARTAGANLILGIGYIAIGILAVGLVVAYPVAMLGVILILIALQLGRTSIVQTDTVWLAVGIGVLGLLINLGLAFIIGIAIWLALDRWR